MQPNNPNPYYPPGPAAGQQPGVPAPQQPFVPPQQAPLRGANDSGKKSTGMIIAIVLLAVMLLGALGFAFWAFSERQDYKNNSDAKVAAAVEVAKEETTQENNLRFAEENKNPLKTYTGPAQYGSVKVSYPKTWSGYTSISGSGGTPMQLMFHPDVVPAVLRNSDTQAIALKIEVREQEYDRVVQVRQSDVQRGETKAVAYALPKMPNEVGIKFTGKISQQFSGTEIVIPIRDKTLVITTETDQFLPDFNKYIVPNLTFEP